MSFLMKRNLMQEIRDKDRYIKEKEMPTHFGYGKKELKGYAHGGMCYAHGGEMHPLDMMFRKKFLDGKKMAYGGKIENLDLVTEPYDDYEEDNRYQEISDEGTEDRGDAPHESKEEPDEDEMRLAFARRYLTSKAVRGR